jgi:adenylate kinase family enzyme
MNRVVVIGVTGAGKSTLAAALGKSLAAPVIELDALHWDAGWQAASTETFRERVGRATAPKCWVVDGNYGQVRDIVWSRADTLIWLDYPLALVLARLTRRTVRRMARREVLWNGNRERFADNFLSRHSLFLWALTSHRKMRERVPIELEKPEVQHLTLHRFKYPNETRAWLQAVPASA